MESSATLNQNLQQSTFSSTIQYYNPHVFESSRTWMDKLLIATREASTQPHILQFTPNLSKGKSRPYDNTILEFEYEAKSGYVPSIEPEPPPYIIQEHIPRPNLSGLYTVHPSIINTIIPPTSFPLQYTLTA